MSERDAERFLELLQDESGDNGIVLTTVSCIAERAALRLVAERLEEERAVCERETAGLVDVASEFYELVRSHLVIKDGLSYADEQILAIVKRKFLEALAAHRTRET